MRLSSDAKIIRELRGSKRPSTIYHLPFTKPGSGLFPDQEDALSRDKSVFLVFGRIESDAAGLVFLTVHLAVPKRVLA
jgi:hypothetical protein